MECATHNCRFSCHKLCSKHASPSRQPYQNTGTLISSSDPFSVASHPKPPISNFEPSNPSIQRFSVHESKFKRRNSADESKINIFPVLLVPASESFFIQVHYSQDDTPLGTWMVDGGWMASISLESTLVVRSSTRLKQNILRTTCFRRSRWAKEWVQREELGTCSCMINQS